MCGLENLTRQRVASAQAVESRQTDAETFADEPSVGRINNGNPRVRRRHLRAAAAAAAAAVAAESRGCRTHNAAHSPVLSRLETDTKSSFVGGSGSRRDPGVFSRISSIYFHYITNAAGLCATMSRRGRVRRAMSHDVRDVAREMIMKYLSLAIGMRLNKCQRARNGERKPQDVRCKKKKKRESAYQRNVNYKRVYIFM